MTTLFTTSNDENNFFTFDDDSSISPTSSFFPSDLFNNQHLQIPQTTGQNGTNGGPSMSVSPQSLQIPSSSSNKGGLGVGVGVNANNNGGNAFLGHRSSGSGFNMSEGTGGSYLSRPPSLSPSSQAFNVAVPSSRSSHSSHSPLSHSSASPSSNFSLPSTTDEMFFNNSFGSSELDMLLFNDLTTSNDNSTLLSNTKDQPFFLPQSNFNNNNQSFNSNGQDDGFDMLNFNGMNNFGNLNTKAPSSMPTMQTPSLPQTIQPQWMNQGAPAQNMQHHQGMAFAPTTAQPQTINQNQNVSMPFNSGIQQQFKQTVPQNQPKPQAEVTAPRKVSTNQRVKAESDSNSSVSPPNVSSGGPAVGKHNKTERRYRQKVQAAQADLRDSVPALRVLYGTSTPEQRATTDFRASDGTVDGLGEITRPNASAKTTIFLGARMYIELLQSRVSSLERKVGELECFRAAITGQDDLQRWQMDFQIREQELIANMPVKADSSDDIDDDGEDDDDEEDVPKRKKTKKVQQGGNKSTTAYRAFAAFAMSFTLSPSAKVQPIQPLHTVAREGGALQQLPLITAEHVSRLLERALPAFLVPTPFAMVAWTWRLLMGVVLYYALRPIFKKGKSESPVGNVSEIVKDMGKLVIGRSGAKAEDDLMWTNLAARILGGVVPVTSLTRFHVMIRLYNTASTPYGLALLALLNPPVPLLRSSEALWAEARSKITSETPSALKTVLSLPFQEAEKALSLLPPTTSPITAMAEQVTLVHINDLLTKMFISLVKATTTESSDEVIESETSLKVLTRNLASSSLSNQLVSISKEIRTVVDGVAKGTVAHALGMVLIGLKSVLTGSTEDARARLLDTLRQEQIAGVGSGLASINALLGLMDPNYTPQAFKENTNLPRNAVAIDTLALACIEYIRLLSSANILNDQESRLQRLEASKKVQRTTTNLRAILTETTFIGLNDNFSKLSTEKEVEAISLDDGASEEEQREGQDDELEIAKERLVSVLSVIGRRAASRAMGRDEDSGLEGDLDEL